MTPQENGIQWTDFTANPVKYRDDTGKAVWACVKVSDGCKNCYAETLAKRYGRGGPFSLPQTKKVTAYFDEKEANTLLKSPKIAGKRVFIGDMTDVFGPWVSFDILDSLFAVFALRPDVTFQVLTKRPERMAEYLENREEWVAQAVEARNWAPGVDWDARDTPDLDAWPLPNVWLGTSVEDQKAADERIPHLLKCPAAVRYLSAEPLLGAVQFNPDWLGRTRVRRGLANAMYSSHSEAEIIDGISWVIVGGESGAGARPCGIGWVRDLVHQCKTGNVAVFVKQLGSRPLSGGSLPDRLKDSKGGDMAEWTEDLRVRQFPAEAVRT